MKVAKKTLEKTEFGKVEKILKEYKHYNAYIRISELNKEIHSDNEEYLVKQDKKIDYYKKMNLNVSKCLEVLNNDELEFVKELYFNGKTVISIIPILRKVLNNFSAKDITILNKCSTIKRLILTKLLNENILGVENI